MWNLNSKPMVALHLVAPQRQEQQQHHEVLTIPMFVVKPEPLDTPSQASGAVQDIHQAHDQTAAQTLPQALVAATVTETGSETKSATWTEKKRAVRYRECRKNQTIGKGKHCVDGCGEFMAGGEKGSERALRCAVCDCHRNFHRRLDQLEDGEEEAVDWVPPRKRFRTVFTADQKAQMRAFAEKFGWRMPKHDEVAVQEFCAEAGVKRQALKVWIQNWKRTMSQKNP